jgi:cytochrome oxidase Cu insertion factor (SCO1/SenC/PrrC family)
MEGMRATVLLSALVALGILTLACADPQTERAPRAGNSIDVGTEKEGAEGGAVRDFSVTSFSGEDFTLSAERGSPVVLNFFESW